MKDEDKIVLRYYKKVDKKNRILIPVSVLKIIKCKEFYIELRESGNIVLIPTGEKNGKI